MLACYIFFHHFTLNLCVYIFNVLAVYRIKLGLALYVSFSGSI